MFTGALINTISTGVAGKEKELSLHEIGDAMQARINDRYGSARVELEVHAPRQAKGDITFAPLFVNRAFVAPAETKAEREDFESALADLGGRLPRTREGAVETLEQLLLSTRSAGFSVEILNKLKSVQEEDDSRRIRTRCEEILGGWREHSPEVNSAPPVPVIEWRNGNRVSLLRRLFGLSGRLDGSGGANKIDEPMRRKDVAFFFRSHTVELCSILSTFLIAIALLEWFYVPAPSSCQIAVSTLAFPSIFGILASISAIYYFINIKKRPILIRVFFVLSIVSLIFGVYTLHKAYEILPLCREFT